VLGSTLEVHSNHFDLRVDGKNALLSVFSGYVKVANKSGEMIVKKDQGAVINQDKTSQPEPLPGITQITSPGAKSSLTRVLVPISCAPLPGTARYAWECSSNPEFSAVLAELWLPEARGLLDGVDADGPLYLRVRTVSASGLVGPPSKIVAFKMAAFKPLKRIVQLTHNFFINGKYADAIGSAAKGLEIYPEHRQLLEELCLSHLSQKQLSMAIQTARRIKSSSNFETRAAFEKVLRKLREKHPNNVAIKALGKK